MSLSLYDVTVPTYLQILSGVKQVLQKGADHAATGAFDREALVHERMYEDMLPFSFQVVSVWNHTLCAVKSLETGLFGPSGDMGELNYARLQGLIDEAIDGLNAVTPEQVNACSGKPVKFKMGDYELPFTAENFALSFSIPNQIFHASTTYAMLRQKGVPLGKQDFIGPLRLAV